MYNMTQLHASDTISKLVTFANDATSGLLVILFMWAFFLIMLMVMKRYDFDESLLSASMISFVVSLILVYINMLPLIFSLLFLIMGSLTAFYTFVVKK